MPKKPRLKGEQLYHHIYAWGNDRHPVFKTDYHYNKYISYLEVFSRTNKIDIIAYALMEGHVHLFVYDRDSRISQFINSLHGEYAQFFNKDVNRVGHVFGERYNNKVVQLNNYGLWLSRYIHRQAVQAGIVNDPKDYQWTSYCSYIGLAPKGFIKPAKILEQFGQSNEAVKRYKNFVLGIDDEPFDWANTSRNIVGDDIFEKSLNTEQKMTVPDYGYATNKKLKSTLKAICERLNVRLESLVNPVGEKEFLLRREAWIILNDEVGISFRLVGKLFNVSATAVFKAVKKGRVNKS